VSVNNFTVTTNNDRQTLVLPANNRCQHFIMTKAQTDTTHTVLTAQLK